MLVRFAAGGLVGLSALELGLYVADCIGHHQPIGIPRSSFLFLLFVLGIVVFIRARSIAEWIESRFD